MSNPMTTRQVAAVISLDGGIRGAVHEWQVRRLFEEGDLPEPPKFGGKRMIDPNNVPVIVEALRVRGWLSSTLQPA